MADSTIAAPLVDVSTVSIARLHGEACWHCGEVTDLRPAGEVATAAEGAPRVWPIVACREHRGRPPQPRPMRMQSTLIGTDAKGRPVYAVHEVGTEPPASIPPCVPGCLRCAS